MHPITIDLTGPDWEPEASIKWYAQCGGTFAFGPDPHAALAALLLLLPAT
jgi:hypothetical protein